MHRTCLRRAMEIVTRLELRLHSWRTRSGIKSAMPYPAADMAGQK